MVVAVQRVFILSSTVPHTGDRVENHFLPKQIYFKWRNYLKSQLNDSILSKGVIFYVFLKTK